MVWADNDEVDVALGVGITSGERTEDDDTHRGRLDVSGGIADPAERRLANVSKLHDEACGDVLPIEKELRSWRNL